MRRKRLLTLLLALSPIGDAIAQEAGAPKNDPAEVSPAGGPQGLADLKLPKGVKGAPPEAPFARYTPDSGGERVVRVVSELGARRLVKLPTGELSTVARSRTRPADGPLTAAPDDEIVARLREDGVGDFRVVRTGYYLFAYDCSEAYFLHTRSILESMLRGVVKQLAAWDLRPRRPETPLVVVIFPSRAAFDAYHEMPAGVAAYYNLIDNRVILYEDERLFDAAPEFALKRASYVVAHESIHQLLGNCGVQQRLSGWPAWISEGLPEYFCPLRVTSSLAKTDGDQLPVRTVRWTEAGMVNDLRMHDLLRTPGQGGEVIRTVVGAPGLTAHGYSVAWGLVHFLAERKREEFAAYLKDVSRLRALRRRPDEPPPRGPDPLFVKHFGDDYAALEAEVRKHLTGRKLQRRYRDPYVNQTHYVVSVTFKRGRTFYTQADVMLSPASARKWTADRRKLLKAEGISAHILTRECRTAKEAAFHLRKMMN